MENEQIIEAILSKDKARIKKIMEEMAAARDMLLCKYLLETDAPAEELAIYQQKLKDGSIKIWVGLKSDSQVPVKGIGDDAPQYLLTN